MTAADVETGHVPARPDYIAPLRGVRVSPERGTATEAKLSPEVRLQLLKNWAHNYALDRARRGIPPGGKPRSLARLMP